MNAKISIAMMLLLVLGIFSTTTVMADDVVNINAKNVDAISTTAEQVEVVEATEIVSEEIESTDVTEIVEEVEESSDKKRIGFIRVWKGHGWINNGEEGHLITGLWAVQKFANINSNSKEIEEKSFVRAFGRLHIAGSGMYKLVRYKDEISEETVNFYVVPLRKKVNVNSAESASVGKLSLTAKESFRGLTTWEGVLNFDFGDLTGSWDVELGTNVHKVKPRKLVDVERVRIAKEKALEEAGVESIEDLTDEQKVELRTETKKAVKKSFWSRFRFWRRG